LGLLLILVAPLPSAWLVGQLGSCDKLERGRQLCEWTSESPIIGVNILFFLNVDVGFWLLSLVQNSTWLIDPYWCVLTALAGQRPGSDVVGWLRRTLIPPLIAHFYRSHPQLAQHNPNRSLLALALVWAWALRLTHNYFRRERYDPLSRARPGYY
jgi:steroid 5-alpha reductase family enzyme